MSATYRLVLKSGTNTGQIFPLDGPELIIGREPASDIVINDPEVSRRHARLYLQGQNYVIEDFGSTNGTSVNGQRLVGPYILRPGEMITLGENTHLLFEELFADPDATRASVNQAAARSASPVNPQPVQQAVYPASQYNQPIQPAGVVNEVSQADANYTGQVPDQPAAAKSRRSLRTILIIVIVLLLLVLCACLAIFWYIDANNLYCQAVPGITNIFFPNACP